MSERYFNKARQRASNGEEPVEIVSMTCQQWDMLELYLAISREYREGTCAAYEQQKNKAYPNGAARFPDAASNIQFWKELCTAMDSIQQTLAERESVHGTKVQEAGKGEEQSERNRKWSVQKEQGVHGCL